MGILNVHISTTFFVSTSHVQSFNNRVRSENSYAALIATLSILNIPPTIFLFIFLIKEED
jgi:hypothetical protein